MEASKANRKTGDQRKTADSPESKKYTILVADDDVAVLQSIVSVLERKYSVLTATNGQEALEIIEGMKSPENINVILADQQMPHLTGVEFLEKTLPIIPKTIRMILTGFADINAIIDGINRGQIYQIMTKPVDPIDMMLTIKRALEAYELEERVVEKTARLLDIEKLLQHELDEAFIRSLTPKEMRWFVDAVKGIVLCDKSLSEEELSYLRTIVSFLSDKNEANRLIRMVKQKDDTSDLDILTGIERNKAFEMMVILVNLAIVDGNISQAESEFILYTGNKLGFKNVFCNKLLTWAYDKITVEEEHQQLRRIAKNPALAG